MTRESRAVGRSSGPRPHPAAHNHHGIGGPGGGVGRPRHESNPKPEPLSAEQLAQIEAALGAVLDGPADFHEFQVDFAFSMADRVEKYGADAFVSAKQWAVIARIETRAAELADGGEHSTREVITRAHVCAVNSAMAELRAAGIMITCARRGRYWYYRLGAAR